MNFTDFAYEFLDCQKFRIFEEKLDIHMELCSFTSQYQNTQLDFL